MELQYAHSKPSNTIQKKEQPPFFNKLSRSEQPAKKSTQGTTAPFFAPSPIQTKLKIGSPNDRYEKEADAVADQVVAQTGANATVQRKCAKCTEEDRLQRKPAFESEEEGKNAVQTKLSDAPQGLQLKCPECAQEDQEEGEAVSIQQKPDVQNGPVGTDLIQRSPNTGALNMRLPPRRRTVLPPISAPPIPAQPAPPATCPSRAEKVRQLARENVHSKTKRRMQYAINLERSRASVHRPYRLSRRLINRADRAVRRRFGSYLPAGRRFSNRSSVTTMTPTQFSQHRIPDAAAAKRTIGQVALEAAADELRQICIQTPTDAILQQLVAIPIFNDSGGIQFVRNYEMSRIGGETDFTSIGGGRLRRHVNLPDRHRYLGHIIVHEAIHFYVSNAYYNAANGHPLEDQLTEGGAEFLARHVLFTELSSRPEFKVHTSTYSSEFQYVSNHLLRGGLSVFANAYFKGLIGLIGLSPSSSSGRGTQPPTRPRGTRSGSSP